MLVVPQASASANALEVVEDFFYLGSTVNNCLSLNAELKKRTGKEATSIARFSMKPLADQQHQDGLLGLFD